MRVAAVLAGLALVLAPAADADGGGGGSYLAVGNDYDFTLSNTGATAWRGFYLVAPSGVTFVGGTTGNEGSATCTVGQPDGVPNEIECAPLALNILPPTGSVAFVATTSAKALCGTTFQLFVSFDGVAYSHAADLGAAAGCGVEAVTLIAPPLLHGTPIVGRTIRASPPIWSVTPTHVAYVWQRCAGSSCATIDGASGLTLVLTKRDVGHRIRVVSAATIEGTQHRAMSSALAVR
ncbi:MAG: hypothetical protein JO017_08690 [Actinobacteria bacterium]|nr:hypothetical protein [Actinomycetota bacterium]